MTRDESPIPMTREALEGLKSKLEKLKGSLPEQIAITKAAAELGDRSENAEYQLSKSRLRSTHRQILMIENQIRRATVIKAASSDRVQLGSTVVLESDGKKFTFQILGPFEADPGKGVISNQSPLGKVLIGHKVGEEVEIKTEAGKRKYQIFAIY